MKHTVHILNGDCLKRQFPKPLNGEILIMRECLVDGEVQSNSLNDLFRIRAAFICNHYSECSADDYSQKVVSEFIKMQSLPDDTEIILWFEEDLFCQVNLWFVIHLLNSSGKNHSIHLVRPLSGHEYCFAEMTEKELLTAYANKTKINSAHIQTFSEMWTLYQNNRCTEMIQIANKLTPVYPFLLPACEAHADRFPKNGSPGRPEQSIIRIMKERKTTDFPLIFREFIDREPIYGFGDLQVKRLYKKVIANQIP